MADETWEIMAIRHAYEEAQVACRHAAEQVTWIILHEGAEAAVSRGYEARRRATVAQLESRLRDLRAADRSRTEVPA